MQDQFWTFINKTEGRDKFSKFIQYSSRILKWTLLDSNKDMSTRFAKMQSEMGKARKLNRLFKSFNEHYKMQQLLANLEANPNFENVLNIITRIGFFFYWVFDNLAVLSTIKFLHYDAKSVAKKAFLSWFIGLSATMVVLIRKLIKSYEDESSFKTKAVDAQNSSEALAALKKLSSKRRDLFLQILKTTGDMIPASNGIELPQKLLGTAFNEGVIGAGGLISSLITMYTLFPARK
eukprot:CAMPEP_0114989140 /NCGR_PEP_ID=MMETSP0216-20121206/10019_1 /TAXON_ID=223996 /ORGANISM="Protocruzia adherens, Strain Boccale" /LENGTH=234 /DNA_ID=CAMNT_0002352059 /DNA_START=224 /DNA_END=928 /DNA_ORIENTATION=+